MAVTLRLARHGTRSRPFYRVVAIEKAGKRDGRFIELVGTYDPKTNPSTIVLKEDKVRKWVGLGAKPSRLVRGIIIKSFPGLVEGREKHALAKLQAARKSRKLRNKARATKK